MKRQEIIAVAAIIVGLAVIAGVVVLFIAEPSQPTQTTTTTPAEIEVTYDIEETVFTIDGAGNATAVWIAELSPSSFTDLQIIAITGGPW